MLIEAFMLKQYFTKDDGGITQETMPWSKDIIQAIM